MLFTAFFYLSGYVYVICATLLCHDLQYGDYTALDKDWSLYVFYKRQLQCRKNNGNCLAVSILIQKVLPLFYFPSLNVVL